MIKLRTTPVTITERITLPETWHEKLITFGKMHSCPYVFTVVDTFKLNNKEKYFLCEGEKKERGKKIKIALSEYVIRYSLGQEMPDSNIGFSFKDYMPLEGSQLLITSDRNPSEVVPVSLQVETELVEIEGESIIALTFKTNYMNGSGFADVRYYSEGSRKSTWKFLLQDDTYMSDYEKMFQDTMIHKGYVSKSIHKLARYLEKEGAIEHAQLLRERAKTHDNSKISYADEMMALSRIINDKSSLKDANKQLSPIKKDAIALHWKHNSHHPEHFKSVLDMSKLDTMEMCCDWHARSTQYKTNFLEYVKTQQENRFHFPDWIFAEIWHYCMVGSGF